MAFRTSRLACCAWVIALCWGVDASAQVVRCTDSATGKVTYTDGTCAPGTAAREVEGRKTPEEILKEREQAAQALEQKQQRLRAEADAAELDRRREAEQRAQRAAASPGGDYAQSAQCARARRNLDAVAREVGRDPDLSGRLDAAQRQMNLDCLGPSGYVEVEKARAAAAAANPPTTTVIIPPRHRPPPAPPPATPPKKFVQCNVFRCYDSQGNSYPR